MNVNTIGAAPFMGSTRQASSAPDAATVAATEAATDAASRLAACLSLSLTADPRFGHYAYVRHDVGPLLRGQASAIRPVFAGSEIGRVDLVDLHDIGFATHHRCSRAGGRPPLYLPAPNAGLACSALLSDARTPFPSRPRGCLMRLPNRTGDADMEFIRIASSCRTETSVCDIIQWVPFSSYQEADGTLVGIARLGGCHYRFRVASWSPDYPQDANLVYLRRANAFEINKYRKYQSLWLYLRARRQGDPLFFVNLNQASPILQRKFTATGNRARTILRDAVGMFCRFPKIATAICARFSPVPDDPATVLETVASVRQSLKTMATAFPLLIRQAGHLVGFFRGEPNMPQGALTAVTIRDSLQYPLDFEHIGGVPMAFNANYFESSETLLDNLAALLLREYSQALIGAADLTHPVHLIPGRLLYAEARHSCYELQPLIDASREQGHGAALHAPLLEHIIMLLAYWARPETRTSSLDFLEGGSAYQRLYTESDFDDITAGAHIV